MIKYWDGLEFKQVHFQIARFISYCDLRAFKLSFQNNIAADSVTKPRSDYLYRSRWFPSLGSLQQRQSKGEHRSLPFPEWEQPQAWLWPNVADNSESGYHQTAAQWPRWTQLEAQPSLRSERPKVKCYFLGFPDLFSTTSEFQISFCNFFSTDHPDSITHLFTCSALLPPRHLPLPLPLPLFYQQILFLK